MQFCRAVDAEPLICLRFHGKAPRDAAEEVEYLNGSHETTMGGLQSRNGHAEPYHVRYWQIGNEIASPQYDTSIGDFARAMKKTNPSMQIFSSFPNSAVIKNAGDVLDFVCPHQYSTDLAGMEKGLLDLGRMIRENEPAGRSIKVAVTEWNTTAGDAGPRRAMLWTLANALACSRYQNLLHRHCDLVTMANRSNLANSFCSGIIQTDHRGRMYLTPTYYAQQLYATHAGTRPLKIEGDATPLDVSATLSSARDELALFVVNDTTGEIGRTIDLSPFGDIAGQKIAVWTLADRDRAGEPDVTNNFEDPQRVVARESSLGAAGTRFDHTFPPLSLTVLKCRVR